VASLGNFFSKSFIAFNILPISFSFVRRDIIFSHFISSNTLRAAAALEKGILSSHVHNLLKADLSVTFDFALFQALLSLEMFALVHIIGLHNES
jgi:hypothetical protein